MGCGYPGLRLAPLLRQHPAPGDHLQGPGALTLTSRVQVPSLLLLGAGLGLLLAPAPASQMVAAVSHHCGISGRQQQLVAELVTTTVVRELGEQLGCSCNAAGVYTAVCVCRRGGGGGLGVRGAARGAGLHRGLQTQQALPRPGEGSHWPWSHYCSYTAQYLATLLLLWSLETVLLLIFPVTSVKTFLATAAETALQWSLNYYR